MYVNEFRTRQWWQRLTPRHTLTLGCVKTNMKTEQEYNAALEKLGGRSHFSVMTITAIFALVGALLIVLVNQGLWGIWIPFCF